MASLEQQADLFLEIDRRESDRIEVSLLRNPVGQPLTVFVYDGRANQAFEIPVTAARAREVFKHPFAYIDRADTAIG